MVTTNQANLIAELYGEIDMLKSRLKELNSQIMANDKKEPF